MQTHTRLKHHGTVPEGIVHPGNRGLFSYWDQLRAKRSAPSRREVELRTLAPILPWLGVMERHATSRRHFWRLAGTGIARLWGGGLTGSEVAAGWPDVYRHTLVRALDGVYDRGQPFVARLKAVSACGNAIGIELLAVPVETDDGASIQAFCGVLPFREPHWLGRVPLVDMSLSTVTAIWTDPLPDEIKGLTLGSARAVPLKLIQGGRSD